MSHSTGAINHDQSEPNVKAIVISIIVTFLLLGFVIFSGMISFKSAQIKEMNAKQQVSMPMALQDCQIEEANKLKKIESGMQKVLNKYGQN